MASFRSTFSEVNGRRLVVDSQTFALNLAARIDEMFLTEQALLWDSEVCAIGQKAASAIIEGAEVAATIAKAKVSAWKLEADAAKSLTIRYEARETDGVPIEELQRDLKFRRERASSKLFKWLNRIEQAPDQAEEAMKMQDAMCVTLSKINDDYRELSESKMELVEIFFELQEGLDQRDDEEAEEEPPHCKRGHTTRQEGAPFHVAGVQR